MKEWYWKSNSKSCRNSLKHYKHSPGKWPKKILEFNFSIAEATLYIILKLTVKKNWLR